MTYSLIRKNAKNRIQKYLEKATYITLSARTSAVDDSVVVLDPQQLEISDVHQFMEKHYRDLIVRLHVDDEGNDEYLRISDGPYYFSDRVYVHFTPKPIENIPTQEVREETKPRMTYEMVRQYLADGFISPLNHGAKATPKLDDLEKNIESIVIEMAEAKELDVLRNSPIDKKEYDKAAWQALSRIRSYATEDYGYEKVFMIINTEAGTSYKYRHDISLKSHDLHTQWCSYLDYYRNNTARIGGLLH